MDIRILAPQFYEYSTVIKGFTKATIKRYRYSINQYVNITGVIFLKDVTEQSFHALFLHGRIERQWKASTTIAIHKSLVVFFGWCQKNGFITTNFVKDIETPKLEKRLPYHLPKQEAFKLLDIVYNYPYKHQFERLRNHAFFAMAMYAGLRKQELLDLRYTNVDIENRSIFIHQGKGNKDRIIPMSFALAQLLSVYITERKRLNKTCPEFFTSCENNKGFNDTALKRLVYDIRKASKMFFTIHKLRHTFATLMLEGGCDILSLAKMMGHSDVKTTMIYLSASPEHLRSQITKHPLNNYIHWS